MSKNPDYECEECDWIYQKVVGDPERGVPPETPWAEVPEDWTCPACGAEKSTFTSMSKYE
jgi:rubredoxin